VKVAGVDVAVARVGTGAPLLLLQSEDGLEAGSPFVAALARDFEVIIPDAPGYGDSPEAERITTVDDIAYLWLDLLDVLDLKNVLVMGFSLGGWIAAEMATKSCARIGRLILVGATGIKVGGPFDRDIADIHVLNRAEVTGRTYADGTLAPDYAAMDDTAVERVARNRLATVKYCWEPYMHNPKLKDRLHRISVPTFVLWGSQDRIVAPDYGRAYAAAIPDALFELIAQAGHLPHLERPDNVLHHVKTFLRAN
jgi:pimeloyl-ACP methyl ester carboxylesterase